MSDVELVRQELVEVREGLEAMLDRIDILTGLLALEGRRWGLMVMRHPCQKTPELVGIVSAAGYRKVLEMLNADGRKSHGYGRRIRKEGEDPDAYWAEPPATTSFLYFDLTAKEINQGSGHTDSPEDVLEMIRKAIASQPEIK